MSRLTKRYELGATKRDITITIGDICEKLAGYEDAEEQGLLWRLPTPIDSEVWGIILRMDDFLGSYRTVARMSFKLDMINKLGETVFLTEEEAEQKLESMKGEA